MFEASYSGIIILRYTIAESTGYDLSKMSPFEE